MAVRAPIGAWGESDEPEGSDVSGGITPEIAELLEDGEFLHAYCQRILGDPVAAEDVVQETYLYAVKNLDRLERRGSYAPWLATVARCRSANEVRRRIRLDLVSEVPDEPACADDDPADAAVTQDTLARVCAALGELSPRERDLLERQVFDGLSISELVGIDDSTASSVKSVLNRARAKLRAAVEDAGTRVLAPVAGLFANLRRHLTNVSAKLQQGGPAAPATLERAGEALTAAVATLVLGTSIAAPASEPPTPTIDTRSSRAVATVSPGVVPATDAGGRTVDNPPPDVAGPDAVLAASPAPDPADHEAPSEPDNDSMAPPLPSSPPPIDHEEPVVPDSEADEPEDASFLSFGSASSAGQSSSSTTGGEAASPHVFGLGVVTANCLGECTVLFRSDDAGASWERATADGLGEATELLVAPGYPDDPRVYAMGPSGLKLSEDAGESFAPVDEPHYGPAAMSPDFSAGDERILIGAPPSWVYDADADRTTPIAAAPLAGRRNHFAFPSDAGDSGVFFAGTTAPGTRGAKTPMIHRCRETSCGPGVELSVGRDVPDLTVVESPDGESMVLAWIGRALFRSVDGGASLEFVDPGVEGSIESVVQAESGTLFLTWAGTDGERSIGGILRSDDGLGWERVTSHAAFEKGVYAVHALPGGELLSAPTGEAGGGLLCSTDDGATWSSRCRRDASAVH